MELGEGGFYQASSDDTEVAIIADYPGLLPVTHVSNQETCPLIEFPLSSLPTAPYYALQGRKSVRKKVAPTTGRLLKRKANRNMAEPLAKRYGCFKYALWPSHLKYDNIRCVLS